MCVLAVEYVNQTSIVIGKTLSLPSIQQCKWPVLSLLAESGDFFRVWFARTFLLGEYWTCLELWTVGCQVFRSKFYHACTLIYSNLCDKVELIIVLCVCTMLIIYCLSSPVLNAMNGIEQTCLCTLDLIQAWVLVSTLSSPIVNYNVCYKGWMMQTYVA